jgi:hypothetical protein
MNIVFSYHEGDSLLALESAKAIGACGMNMRHKATICCEENTPLIPEITNELKRVFPEVKRIVAQDGFNGWPLGPNQMFAEASTYCYSFDEPWMFWEPDCVPMIRGWIDELEKEFNKDKGKIMGCLLEGGVAPSGKNVYRLIVGSAVYPSKFLNGCTIAANLYNYNLRYRDAGSNPEPWDVRCRWEFLRFGRNTDLIKAYWKSCNYQRKNGEIVFFAESPDAQDIQAVTCPSKTVDPRAVVVHGCKDGSLHKMIQEVLAITSGSENLKRFPKPVSATLKTSKSDLKPQKEKKKRRVISDEERERRRNHMREISAKRRERIAKSGV